MNKGFKFFLYLLLFSPFLAFAVISVGVSEYRYFLRPVFWLISLFWFVSKKGKIKVPSYLVYLALYIIYKFCWDFYNYYARNAPIEELIRKPHIEIFFIIIMIENTRIDPKYIFNSFKIIKYTIVVAMVFSLIQLFVNPLFFFHTSVEDAYEFSSIYEVRRLSIFSYIDPNSLGFDFLPLFSVLLGFSLFKKQSPVFFVLAAAIISFSSNTRYIMVGYLIILFQYLVYSKFRISVILKYTLSAFVGVCLTILFLQFAGYDLNAYVGERLFREQDITKSTRYFAFEIFNQFFYQNMWFGTGQHLTSEIENALGGYSSQIHVGYLSHLVSYGLFGSFFLFMFWIRTLGTLFKDAKCSGYYGSVFAFLVFIWANMTLVYYSVFTYGLILSFVYSKYMRDKHYTVRADQKAKFRLNRRGVELPINVSKSLNPGAQ